ncbi:MAG: acyl-CoA synthetase [Brevundimonas sp.]|nr:acyl-CoA synthetase [Brevundimonas sp.]
MSLQAYLEGPYATIRQHGFGDILREQRRSRPDMLAAVDGDLRLTYRELDVRVNKLVSALRSRGVGPGDRLLWLGQNSVKLFESLLAAAKMGCFFVPANWRMSVREVQEILADLDPKVVFWQEAETGETHRTSRLGWSEGRLWVQHDGLGSEHDCFDDLLASGEDIDDEAPIDANLPLLGIYTAAFSGRPGAAMLSHTALMLQAFLSARGQAIDETTRYLLSGPMFHIGILMGGFATFAMGGCNIVVSRPNATELVRLISEEKATHGMIPNPLVADMIAEIARTGADVSSMFATPDMAEWVMPMIMPPHAPQRAQRGGYGQTEIMGLATLAWLGGAGAAGRPHPFAQIKLVDDAGQEVPQGQTGEFTVRGPMVMNGYWNRREENETRTRDGWHRTNDLGRRNADGSLAFIGPKTTMIKSGVENIYPAEVEACIKRHPAVEDVCIIGVPDPTWDQNVKAVVVLRQGAEATPAAIIDHCRASMASYKKPKVVEFVGVLPRTSAGAIDRDAVDAAFGGGGYPRVA